MSSYPHISYEEHQAIIAHFRRELAAAQARERELQKTLIERLAVFNRWKQQNDERQPRHLYTEERAAIAERSMIELESILEDMRIDPNHAALDALLEQAGAEERGRVLSQIEPLFDEWRRGDDGSDDYPPLGAFIAAAIRGEEK